MHPNQESSGTKEYIELYGFPSDLLHRIQWGVIDNHGQPLWVWSYEHPQPGGLVLIGHGYLQHSAFYAPFLEDLHRLGWSVLAFDLPGHGLSDGERAAIDDFSRYAEALDAVLAAFSKHTTITMPLVALGHSTGASMFIEHALENGPSFDGWIFLAPLIRSAQWNLSRTGFALGGGLIEEMPRWYRESSRDQDFMEFMEMHDPLRINHLPTSWVSALFAWNERLNLLEKETWEHAFAGGEVIILQGDADNVVDWRWNLRYLQERIDGSVIRIFPEARHDLQFEGPQRSAPVYGEVALFLRMMEEHDSSGIKDGEVPRDSGVSGE